MGRKEENIKKAQTLLHQKERIRNIGTAAHIDHGKCVSFETRIWVNGRWIRAGDLWAQYANRPQVSNKFGADVRDVRSESLWTQSLDLGSGATEFAQLTHAWRLRATEPLIEVESRDGRRIRTTPEHPFIVAVGVKLDYREARSLRKGDVLVVPRRLPSRRDNEEDWIAFEETIIQRLASDPRFRFHLEPEAQERLGIQKTLDGNQLFQVAKTFRMTIASLYSKIERISVRYPRPGGRVPPDISLPKRLELERFMWLVGLLYGDGDAQARLHMKDEELLERARQALNRLTHRAYFVGSQKRVPFLAPGSSTFVRMLQVVFGYPSKRKAWSIRLPDLLHVAPMPLAAAFIQGYLDADGTVERARSAVSATSVSEEFLDELQLLLLRFGVRSILARKPGKNTIYVSGRKNLARMPQFSDPEKAELQKR